MAYTSFASAPRTLDTCRLQGCPLNCSCCNAEGLGVDTLNLVWLALPETLSRHHTSLDACYTIAMSTNTSAYIVGRGVGQPQAHAMMGTVSQVTLLRTSTPHKFAHAGLLLHMCSLLSSTGYITRMPAWS
jgi:hypothetical protein